MDDLKLTSQDQTVSVRDVDGRAETSPVATESNGAFVINQISARSPSTVRYKSSVELV